MLAAIADQISKPIHPEKVLQFGTGVLLRGLIDAFINTGNRAGTYDGSVVIVKSTKSGGLDAFDTQNSLYTMVVKGLDGEHIINQDDVNTSISRVVNANTDWDSILALAVSEDIDLVISNTTEVGLQYLAERIDQNPPASYPAKLLAFLHQRFIKAPHLKTAIIPTELLVNNATILRNVLDQLIDFNGLNTDFKDWLESHCTFHNSLVDRIVPGKPNDEKMAEHWARLGYEDQLLFEAEVYRLWAIQGSDALKKQLGFSRADTGVVITEDIEIYRELKLRLLNATHTLMCGLSYLRGFKLTRQSLDDPEQFQYIKDLMINEIAPSIPYVIDQKVKEDYALQVLSRFKNPFIDHQWLSITLQYTTKIKMRVVPLLLTYYKTHSTPPAYMAEALAAYIKFVKPARIDGSTYYGDFNGEYLINDDAAPKLAEHWQSNNPQESVKGILSDISLWGTDLSLLPGLSSAIHQYL